MTLVPTGELVAAAQARGGAVGAFNVVTLEHAEAIVSAAEAAGTGVILQISENAVRFHAGLVHPLAAACRSLASSAAAPVALHLDHVTDAELAGQAGPAGFSSLMFDAGAQPYDENVAATAREAQRAHAAGLWVEAELGYVGGKPDQPRSAHEKGVRTDPDEAVAYVAATGVDALAVAVGSSHAMVTQTARLDLELIGRLRAAVPVPLVLHGSSGVPDDELRAAVSAGIAKVNVGTALGKAMTAAVRSALADESLVDPRKYLAPARAAMAEAVAHVLAVLP
ncbi:MAG TPA: class II fructose-bisphosphate aldolase [Jatrophihabitans sp.]|nr:class II fructose-bisphosphate aldolase [Jatrophihabitans sp.]